MRDNTNYKFKAGAVVDAADCSSAVELVAAEAGQYLSVKRLLISADVICNVKILDGDSNVLIGAIYLPDTGGVIVELDPDEVRAAVGTAINIICPTGATPNITVQSSAWVT